MSHWLPYIVAGASVAIIIASFGVWMAWCDLVDAATMTLARQDR